MPTYIVESTTGLAADAVLLKLRPRPGAKPFKFFPGQYACLGFWREDRPTPMRCFSFVNSPDDPQLQFAVRIQGDFTTALAGLQPGEQVRVQGPYGEFAIDKQVDRRVVMVAGGIGITPYMSMLRQAAAADWHLPITLLYSSRRQEDILFFDELCELAKRGFGLRVVFFVTGGAVEPRPDATIMSGPITDAWIKRVTQPNAHGSTYFLCGPNGFMRQIQTSLVAHDVDSDRIVSESFTQTATKPAWGRYSLQTLTYAFALLLLLAGVGVIMLADLDQAVPKLASAVVHTSSPTTKNSADSNSGTSTSNTAPTTESINQYQAPMSSVS